MVDTQEISCPFFEIDIDGRDAIKKYAHKAYYKAVDATQSVTGWVSPSQQVANAKSTVRANPDLFASEKIVRVSYKNSELSVISSSTTIDVLLAPNAEGQFIEQFPDTVKAVDEYGNHLGYSIKINVEKSPELPTLFWFCGGATVVGSYNVAGVCGVAYFDKMSNSNYFITNSHVVVDVGAQANWDEVYYSDDHSIIGNVIRATVQHKITSSNYNSSPKNMQDVALVKLHGIDIYDRCVLNQDTRIDRYESLQESMQYDRGRKYEYWAGTEHVVCSGATPSDNALAEVRAGGPYLQYGNFFTLIRESGNRPQKGHSGALLFCSIRGQRVARGIVFGGIHARNEVWAFDIKDAFNSLGLVPRREI